MEKLLQRSNLIFYLLLFVSAFVPLYPKFPLFNVNGTFVAIRIEDFIIAFVFLLWFIFNFNDIKQIVSKPIIQAILLFWGVGLLSFISAVLITHSVSLHLGFLNWARRVEDIGLFIIAATSIKNSRQLRLYLIVGLITTALVILYGFGQYLGLPVISTTNSEYAKGQILHLNPGTEPNSTFAGHYDLAVFLTVVLIFIATFIFKDRISISIWIKSIKEKLILGITGLGSAALLGLTSERMSFVATIAGLMAVFWIMGRRWLIVGVVLASCFVLVAVPSLRHRLVATLTVNILGGGGPKYIAPPNTVPTHNIGGVSDSSRSASFSAELNASGSATGSARLPRDVVPGEPINTTELGVSRSLNIRTDVEWPRAIMAFEKNPIIGTGYSSLTIATDNDVLRSLGEVGLMGTLALILVFAVIFKQLWKVFQKDHGTEKLFLLATIASTGAVLLTGTVIDVLEASKVAETLWILLGIAWAVSKNYEL